MSAAILTHQTFREDRPAVAANRVTASPEVVDLPPPVRRHTPLVERYGADIAEVCRKVIPVVLGLAVYDQLSSFGYVWVAIGLALGDEVVLIADGRVLQQGPIADVFSRPASLEAARVVGARGPAGRALRHAATTLSRRHRGGFASL